MRKIILTLLLLIIFSHNSYAGLGEVMDDNNGSEGDILLHSGRIQKNKNDVGTWFTPHYADSNRVEGLSNNLGYNNSQLIRNNNRLDSLESLQYNLMGEVNILQGRRFKFGMYGKYNMNRSKTSEVGLKFTISLGDSWETKELIKLKKRLEQLEKTRSEK